MWSIHLTEKHEAFPTQIFSKPIANFVKIRFMSIRATPSGAKKHIPPQFCIALVDECSIRMFIASRLQHLCWSTRSHTIAGYSLDL